MKQKDIIEYFAYGHLPEFLQEVSRPFYELACKISISGNDPCETAVALRKLLESKDAAVRSALR